MSRGKNCLWGLLREYTIKYDPMGNRIWRESVVNGVAAGRKYIVDISGELPTILCEIEDPNSFVPSSLKKSYYYADGQILSQRVHDPNDPNSYTPYFYVHDRLGSVRMVVDDTGAAVCSYTYRPYGAFYDGECVETTGVDNPWKFTGQYYDAEIEQYYLRARQYDPAMMRFTSRDPVSGKYDEPLTLHKYLYCLNNPANRIDPSGLYAGYDDAAFFIAGALTNLITQGITDWLTGSYSGFDSYVAAFGAGGIGGIATLYGGPIVGGALSNGLTNLFQQLSTTADIDWLRVAEYGAVGGALSLFPVPGVKGITTGRNSFFVTTAAMIGKMRKGLITQISSKTFSKIVIHNMVSNAFIAEVEGWFGSEF